MFLKIIFLTLFGSVVVLSSEFCEIKDIERYRAYDFADFLIVETYTKSKEKSIRFWAYMSENRELIDIIQSRLVKGMTN